MRIQHNILAMNAYRNYTNNTSALSKNLEKLSSGYKINRAGDDAAGLAISEKMRAQITGLGAAQKNVKDGISLVKTAEGALSEVHDMLNRMVSLATQSANGTYDGTDRVQLQKELDQLRTEINRISEASNFNGIKLLDGSMDTSGGVKNVSSVSRMLTQVGTGAGNVGRVTILDSDPRITSGKTEFDMDFTGLTTSNVPVGKTKAARTISELNFDNVSFKVNLDFGEADEVLFQAGDTFFRLINTDEAVGAAEPDGSKEHPYIINCSGKTMAQVADAIVDTLKANSANGTTAVVTIQNEKFTVEAASGALVFKAQNTGSAKTKFKDAAGLEKAVNESIAVESTFAPSSSNSSTPIKVTVTAHQGKGSSVSQGVRGQWDIDLGIPERLRNFASNGHITVHASYGGQQIKITVTKDADGISAAVATRGGGAVSGLDAKYDAATGKITFTGSASTKALTSVSVASTTFTSLAAKPANASVASGFTRPLPAGSSKKVASWDIAFSRSANNYDFSTGKSLDLDITIGGKVYKVSIAADSLNTDSTDYQSVTIEEKTPGEPPAPTFKASIALGGTGTNQSSFTLRITADASGATSLSAIALTGGATNDLAGTSSEVQFTIGDQEDKALGAVLTPVAAGSNGAAAVWNGIQVNLPTGKKAWGNEDEKLVLTGKIGTQAVKITVTFDGARYNAAITTASGATLTGYTVTYNSANGSLSITAAAVGSQTLSNLALSWDTNINGVDDGSAKYNTGNLTPSAPTVTGVAAGTRVEGSAGSINFKFNFFEIGNGDTIAIGTNSFKLTGDLVDDPNALVTKLNGLTVNGFSITASYTNGNISITLKEVGSSTFGTHDENALRGLWGYVRGDGAGGTGDASAADANGVAPANSAAPAAETSASKAITFGVKLAGQTLVDAIGIKADANAKEIAAAVWGALKEKYKSNYNASTDKVSIKLDINGATYNISYASGSAKLHFALVDEPTKDNINGNFDWNITGETSKFGDNHDGGTVVTQAGRAVVSNQSANTIFRIEQGDIKEGATITLTGHDAKGETVYKTVTLHVGLDGQDDDAPENGIGHVYLTEDEARNLGTVLSRISQAFGGQVGDLIVGVNDRSNGDGHMGLAVKHVNTHANDNNADNVYLTMEEFAKVFSLQVPRNPEGTGLILQIGDTADSYNQLQVSIAACDSAALGLDGVDISTQTGAANAVDAIKAAINYVSDVRGTLGATQNRLEHTQNNLSVMAENIQDAESTIRDTDVAEEMMQYVKNNILIQSAQAMLAQANQIPQGVLQLLG